MSVGKQTIARLEREIKKLRPEEEPLALCTKLEDGTFQGCSGRVYQTANELIMGEGLKKHNILLIIDI